MYFHLISAKVKEEPNCGLFVQNLYLKIFNSQNIVGTEYVNTIQYITKPIKQNIIIITEFRTNMFVYSITLRE